MTTGSQLSGDDRRFAGPSAAPTIGSNGMTSEMGKDVNEVATAVSDIRPVDLLGSSGLLENAIRSALAAVVVIDGSGKIRGWSGTAQKTFGWAAREVLGRQLTGFIIPERYRAGHRRGLRRFKQTGRGRVVGQVLELAAIDRDGREFPVEIAINPLAELEGEPVFVAFIRDISDRKAAEEGQAALAAELEQSRESLREFIGLIVHELRAPLGVAHGYSEMLADGSLGPVPTRIRSALTMIRTKNQEAQRLVEQLLLAARVETNALGVVLASIDISSVLSEAASRAEGLVKLNGSSDRHRHRRARHGDCRRPMGSDDRRQPDRQRRDTRAPHSDSPK